MEITGAILIGSEDCKSNETFGAIEAASGEGFGPRFYEADTDHVDKACREAARAFATFRDMVPTERASLLEGIAESVLDLGDALIECAMRETGLPRARLEGERGRTVGQLRLFASVVREGSWMDVTIDPAQLDRTPLPRPDLRRINQPLGPVAIFGASNFPLAFSVAGGDTASALAAGCPVVVKGHPAHPGTGELVARAVRAAIAKAGLPAGIFSYLPGTTHRLGEALVAHSETKAVGFTGSRRGGLALVRIANGRPQPIPVYAEMSSVNPVILFPAAAKSRGAALGEAYVASLTQGSGQFCTNPGLVIALAGSDLNSFETAAANKLALSGAGQMLTPAIHAAFDEGVAKLAGQSGVETVAKGLAAEGPHQTKAALFGTSTSAFAANPALGDEIFGPSSLIVRATDMAALTELVRGIEGELTATLLFDDADADLVAPLVPLLAERVGRVLANGWPTGVEVSHAMVHGGPFPATSDGRSTSVGTLAIARFLRPVCYQNFPDYMLPPALRDDNPYHLSRHIDGVMTTPR